MDDGRNWTGRPRGLDYSADTAFGPGRAMGRLALIGCGRRREPPSLGNALGPATCFAEGKTARRRGRRAGQKYKPSAASARSCDDEEQRQCLPEGVGEM